MTVLAEDEARDERRALGVHEPGDVNESDEWVDDALPPGAGPADAMTAVLCTLAEKLDQRASQGLVDALPREVQPLAGRCPRHRDEHTPTRWGGDEFYRRVVRHFEHLPDDAEELLRVVFIALGRQLPRELHDDVANQLPAPIGALWQG